MDKTNCPRGCPYNNPLIKASEGVWGGNKVFFVAHRADERIFQPALFGGHEQALVEVDSGRALRDILKYCKLTTNDVFFTNIFRCVLSFDEAVVRDAGYICCETNLERDVRRRKPEAMVSLGEQAFRNMFPSVKYDGFLEQVGNVHSYHGTPTLVMHHLSKVHRLPKPENFETIKQFLRQYKVIS